MGMRRFVGMAGLAGALAVAAVGACVGEDPILSGQAAGDAATDAPQLGDGAALPDAPLDAPDGAPPISADGGLLFALNLPQNLGSPASTALAFDGSGNAFVAMKFNVPTSLGGKSMMPAGGGYDVGVIKLAPNGDALWMVQFGGTGEDAPSGIAADSNGNVYVVGGFNSTALGALPHRGNGQYDAFLLKLKASDGSLVDAIDLVAASGNGACTSVSAQADRVAVGCTLTGAASVRNATGVEESRAPVHIGTPNVFVALLDPTTLREKWSSSIGGDASDRLSGVALGPTGDVLIAGSFDSSTLSGAGGAIGIPRKSTGGAGIGDAFALRLLGSSGTPLWGKGYGSGDAATNHVYPTAVAVAASGDFFVVGELKGTVALGVRTATAPSTQGDVFVARLKGADGETSWVRAFGGAAFDTAYAAAPAPGDGVYVAGAYFSTGFAIDGNNLSDPLATTSNIFSARLDTNGSSLWANGITTASSSTYTQAYAAASDPSSGAALFGGTFKGFVNLGDGKPVFSHLDGGGYDLFVVKRAQ